MHKWIKRTLLSLALLLLTAALIAGGSYALLKRVPDFYRPNSLTLEQVARFSQTIENKMRNLQSKILDPLDPSPRNTARRSASAPAEARKTLYEVTISEDELNAIFRKWDELNGWKSVYSQVLSDPTITLVDGKVIFAGAVKFSSLETVVSVHFEPVIDDQGELRLNLTRVLGGRLPLPRSVLSKGTDRVERELRAHLPGWQRRATLDKQGVANESAVKASLSKLLLATLRDTGCQAVAFIPTSAGSLRSLAIKLDSMSINGKEMTFRFRHFKSDELPGVLESITAPDVPPGSLPEKSPETSPLTSPDAPKIAPPPTPKP